MKLMYSSPEKNSLIMFKDDGSHMTFAFPPTTDEEKKIVEDYGGQYAIEKTYIDYHREEEEFLMRISRQENQKITFTDSFAIDAMIKEELTKPEMMKIKMSVFAKDEVKKCKNRELLMGLRKAKDIVDVMKFFGLIRDDVNK